MEECERQGLPAVTRAFVGELVQSVLERKKQRRGGEGWEVGGVCQAWPPCHRECQARVQGDAQSLLFAQPLASATTAAMETSSSPHPASALCTGYALNRRHAH